MTRGIVAGRMEGHMNLGKNDLRVWLRVRLRLGTRRPLDWIRLRSRAVNVVMLVNMLRRRRVRVRMRSGVRKNYRARSGPHVVCD